MTYILNYSSIIRTVRDTKSRFGGSSKFRVVEDELQDIGEIRKQSPKYQLKKRMKELDKKMEEKKRAEQLNLKTTNQNQDEEEEQEQVKRTYHLNKSKVRRKCIAFSRLEKSKKFFAFYTISFPKGLTDETAYKLFNTWLTRCRKKQNLKSYLWVAERQKNNTIHYHLLTNDYMAIGIVNGFMATSLTNEKKKGDIALKEVDTSIYNGVDVKRVGKGRKALIGYLSKYITKNEIEFYRLPWHSSRDVSRLFTSINFEDDNEAEKYFGMLPNPATDYSEVMHEEYFSSAGFKFDPDEKMYEDLDDLNEIIYNSKN